MLDILDSVTLGNEKYPIHFGMGAMAQIMKALNKNTLEDMFSAEVLQHLEGQIEVVKAGLIHGGKKHNRVLKSTDKVVATDFTTEDIYELFDDYPQEFNSVISSFMDSIMTRQAKALGEDPKKFKERVLKKGIEIIEKQQELSPLTESKK